MAQAPIAAAAKGHDDTSVLEGGVEERKGREIRLFFQTDQSNLKLEKQ